MNKEQLKSLISNIISQDNYKNILSSYRSGFIELEFDDNTNDSIANDASIGLPALQEAVSEAIGNTEMDVNLLGFDDRLKKISALGANDVGRLVKIRGFVNAITGVKPMFKVANFRCRKCKEVTPCDQTDPFKLIPPLRCYHGDGKHKCGGLKLDIDANMSEYIDSRQLTIQEEPEDISGQIPQTTQVLILKKSLLSSDKIKCGDYVNIIGVIKVKVHTSSNASRFGSFYIEANNVIVKRKDPDVSTLLPEDIIMLKELSKREDIYELLIKNIAPSLYGLEDEKEACLLALAGGNYRKLLDINRRGLIHVLFVGDPSVGKSQLLGAVSKVSPLGFVISGKGASSVGLTAAVTKDTEGDWILSAGVVVLADRGIACIDEIDKMSPEDRVAMHEAMEQQRISIHKATIHTELPARTTIIAAANPSMGRYDSNKSISDNIKNLPVTLLSRFDLIFIIKDVPSQDKDTALAKHILQNGETKEEILDRNVIKKYIIFAKSLNPVMTKEASEYIWKIYPEMRSRQSENDPIPITARQLEALVRLSEAHARIMLREIVTMDDIKVAERILMKSLKQTCSGDIDTIETGTPKKDTDKMTILINILRENGELPQIEFQGLASEKGIGKEEFYKLLMKLINTNQIIKPSINTYKSL